MELVRKPTRIYLARGTDPNTVDMGGQTHVVLKVLEVVTHKLSDDSILLLDLLFEGAELLLQGLDATKLLSLHDHCIVRVVHRVIRLEVKSVDRLEGGSTVRPTTDWTSAIEWYKPVPTIPTN